MTAITSDHNTALQGATPGSPAPHLGGITRFRRAASLHIGRDDLLNLMEVVLEPAVMTLTLWAIAFFEEGELTLPYLILSLMLFSLSFPAKPRLQESFARSVVDILLGWGFLCGIVLFFGYATQSLGLFSSHAVMTSLWVTPLVLVGAQGLFRLATPLLLRAQGSKQAVVIGMNEQGAELATRLAMSPYTDLHLLGFFDDRNEGLVAVWIAI